MVWKLQGIFQVWRDIGPDFFHSMTVEKPYWYFSDVSFLILVTGIFVFLSHGGLG